jgi:hypothetical protein
MIAGNVLLRLPLYPAIRGAEIVKAILLEIPNARRKLKLTRFVKPLEQEMKLSRLKELYLSLRPSFLLHLVSGT